MNPTIFLAVVGPMLECLLSAQAADATKPTARSGEKERHLRSDDVFDLRHPVIFQDDFKSGHLSPWSLSEDDRYNIPKETPERLQIQEAPGLSEGRKAVRFAVPRAPNSFRSEISLPYEKGYNERWYAERMLIPGPWVFDSGKGNDIVMQWHAIPGTGKATFPNLEISVGSHSWFVRQSFGLAQTKPTRTSTKLDDPVQRGTWVSWVVHVRWSPGSAGLLQIWKDGKLVIERSGANVYTDIGVEYTPYLKTGIYHPEWHLDSDRKREAFAKEKPVATDKVIYVTEVKVGSEKAKLEDVAPQP